MPLLKRYFLQSYSSAITAIVILVLVFTIFTDSFLTAFNIYNLSRTAAVYAFIAAAQVIVMVIGDMNLAIGAVGALSTVVMGTLIQDYGFSTLPAVLVALAFSIVCGLITGLLVVKLNLNPFIITLAMSFIFNGLAIGYSHGYSYEMTEDLTWIGRVRISMFSFLFILMIVLVVLLYLLFRHTKYGRDVLAVGGNRTAARLSGINVNGVILSCNVLSCAFACLASILWASRTGTASPNTGSDWMLYSIAVCAIGGIPLLGGRFTALGFFCGAWILTMVRNGLTMLNVDAYYEQVFLGLIILLAVSVEAVRLRVSEKLY
jgi:ribose transport system permease protein